MVADLRSATRHAHAAQTVSAWISVAHGQSSMAVTQRLRRQAQPHMCRRMRRTLLKCHRTTSSSQFLTCGSCITGLLKDTWLCTLILPKEAMSGNALWSNSVLNTLSSFMESLLFRRYTKHHSTCLEIGKAFSRRPMHISVELWKSCEYIFRHQVKKRLSQCSFCPLCS